MKISIQTDDTKNEIEIQIICNQLTQEVEKIIETLRILGQQLTGSMDGETFILDISDVLYIETVDKKTFIYTETGEYESSLKLYELQQKLEEASFIRVGKSIILNMKHIKSLKTDLNRRIRVTIENGEQVIVSRQYAEQLKKRLGIK